MSALTDGNFKVAAKTGGKRVTYPFEGDNASYFTEQDWTQDRVNFVPLALNSPDSDDTSTFLTGETPLQDLGGGFSKWTRIYANVPVTRDEFETFAYTFPGWVAIYNSTYHNPWKDAGVSILPYFPIKPPATLTDPGRIPFARKVHSRLRHDYFLVGANGAYEKVSDIPLREQQHYRYGSLFGPGVNGELPDRILWPASANANYSTPTVDGYKAIRDAAAGDTPNDSTGAFANELVAEDSEIHRWKGNIYERVTRYVRAQ